MKRNTKSLHSEAMFKGIKAAVIKDMEERKKRKALRDNIKEVE